MRQIHKPKPALHKRLIYFKKNLFQRGIPEKMRQEVLKEIEASYHNLQFYSKMKIIKENSGEGKARLWRYKNNLIVVKETYGELGEGAFPEEITKAITAHKKAEAKGELKNLPYEVRAIPVYGVVGNLLIMQYVKEAKLSPKERKSFEAAVVQLEKNFTRLQQRGHFDHVPQTDLINNHIICGGKRGNKWIIYTPMDIR